MALTNELDGRRKELERQLSTSPAPDPVRFHPSMAKTYRTRVGQLIRGMSHAEDADEAKEALRALVDKIVLSPKPDGEGLTIDLHGALAGLLRLATGQQPAQAVAKGRHANSASGGNHEAIDNIEEFVMVAGARFQKYLPLHHDRWPAQQLFGTE